MIRTLFFFFFLSLISLSADLSAKIRIITFHCNKPEFLELQAKTFSKFMQNDYDFIVINDAKTEALEKDIRKICDAYGIQCVRYDPSLHETDPLNFRILDWLHSPDIYSLHFFEEKTIKCISNQPSVRHSHLIQYALTMFGYGHNDIVAIVDGDVFPIRPFNIRHLLENRDIVAVRKRLPENEDDPLTKAQIDYLWVTFAAFNPKKIPDAKELQFQVDLIGDVIHDTGAASYHYLISHPEVSVSLFPRVSSQSLAPLTKHALKQQGFKSHEINFIKSLPSRHFVEFYADHKLLHFSNSCFDLPGYREKMLYVETFVNKLLRR